MVQSSITTSQLTLPRLPRLPLLIAVLCLVAAACGRSASDLGQAPEPDGGSGAKSSPGAGQSAFAELDQVVQSVVGTWETDWTRSNVPLGELFVGIRRDDPRDAIPPIDEPKFETVDEAAGWLADETPGTLLRLGETTRFYPLAIMTRHEIVNDRVGEVPVAVTYCPLCNSALAFDRRVDGEELRFGVSGLLRKSDLVMWDDRTTSLWQQITGDAIVGTYAGTQLERLDTSIVSFSQFAEAFPEGESLSRDTGFGIQYGINPYVGYSSSAGPISAFFDEDPDPRYPALERVLGVTVDGTERAYPFSAISSQTVINDTAGETPVVVFWSPGTADALDEAVIADSREIGTAIVFGREVDGTLLTFSSSDTAGRFFDDQTQSEWNIFGQAVAGEMEGKQLSAVAHRNEFWFAWAGFFPNGEVYEP